MPVLAVELLRHADDGVDVLWPAVYQNLHIADEKCANQLHWITFQNFVDVLISIDELDSAERFYKLRGNVLQNGGTIPGNLAIHRLNDEGLVVHKRATNCQLNKSRLARNGELGRTISALDGNVLVLDQPVVATGQDRDRIRLICAEQTTVKHGDMRITPDRAGALHRHNAGLHAKLGATTPSLCEEEAQGDRRTLSQVQAVQVEGLLHGIVHTTQVNDKTIVHEDPNIIISPKCKLITTRVHEGRMQFEREVEVVLQAIERNGTVLPPLAIHREKVRIIMHVCSRVSLVQVELEFDPPIHPRNITKPLIEVRLVRQLESALVDWLLVRTEGVFHKAFTVPIHRLEVRVVSLEVPDHRIEEDRVRKF
mmetsp:Transcript_63852/g.88717  ORF Transcript_63852/g.88717 Transcript_63852/m.88717 type:complete len:367 (-) Transcript_63852:215-1315(-)